MLNLIILTLCTYCYASCVNEVGGKAYTVAQCSYDMYTPQDFLNYATSSSFPTKPKVSGPQSKIFIDTRDSNNPTAYFFDLGSINGHMAFSQQIGLYNDFISCPQCDPCTSCGKCTTCSTCKNTCHVYGKVKYIYAIDFQSYVDVDLSVIFCCQWNPEDDITQWQILAALEVVKGHLHFVGTQRVAFCRTAPVGAVQQDTSLVADQIRAMGFEILQVGSSMWGKRVNGSTNIGPLPPDQFFWPMHEGETWGYLKLYPNDVGLLEAFDIPLFSSLPLDLGVVAGVITMVQQTVNSHINLKSNERDTPNMVLLNADTYPCFVKYNNKPIHLVVSDYGFLVEPSTVEEVNAQQEKIYASKFWYPLYHTTSEELLSFDEMCPDSPADCITLKKTYGTKAASLGFLANKNVLGRVTDKGSFSSMLGYNATPVGLGIPFQYFYDFMNYPPNQYIRDMIIDYALGEINGTVTQDVRYAFSEKIIQLIRNAVVPPTMLEKIRAKLLAVYGLLDIWKFKFRSSSNAEDLPGFDGAGLYDSFSAHYKNEDSDNNNNCTYDPIEDDIDPPTIQCALKGVYGSLFNSRALDERTFARFKHNSCLMGISVVAKYGELGSVTGNGVGVTSVSGSSHTGYTWSLQLGDNDVTNPDPGTTSETSLALVNEDMSYSWFIQRYAIPYPGGATLTTNVVPRNLMDLAQQALFIAEEAYCIYGFKLTPEECKQIRFYTVKRSLDVELKFLDNERIHFKQIREFLGYKNKDLFLNNTSGNNCSWYDESAFRDSEGKSYDNVAYQKNTTQINTASVGGPSKYAVDGIVEGLFSYTTHTNVGNGVWWQVDLGDSYRLAYIRIWGRSDCCFDQLKNFNVQLIHQNGTIITTLKVNEAGQRMYLFGPLDYITTRIRTVKVIQNEYLPLALAEVQVYALPILVGDPAKFILPPLSPIPDCVWSTWDDWSECTAVCGGGTQMRTRTPNDWCSNYDISSNFQNRTCNDGICCEVSLWSPWNSCNCDGEQFRIRQVTVQGSGCPSTQDKQSCDPPSFCTDSPTSNVGSNDVATFSVTGINDPNDFTSKLESMLEKEVNTGTVTVVTAPTTQNGTYTVDVYYTGDNSNDASNTIMNTLGDSQFQDQLKQQTGASIVQGSVTSSSTSSATDESPPYWTWIIVGLVAVVLIAVAGFLAVRFFSNKSSEIV